MGHKLQMYENLRDMLEKEVTGIEKKGELDPQGLDNLYKLMTALKVTDKCIEREQGGESFGNRRSYGSYGSYDSYDSYGGYGNANANGMSNARRGRDGDGDGRYNESRESMESRESRESRDNFRNRSYRGRESYENAYGYGYSRDNSRKKMVEKLTTLMDDTLSEQERTAIMDCIEKIK